MGDDVGLPKGIKNILDIIDHMPLVIVLIIIKIANGLFTVALFPDAEFTTVEPDDLFFPEYALDIRILRKHDPRAFFKTPNLDAVVEFGDLPADLIDKILSALLAHETQLVYPALDGSNQGQVVFDMPLFPQ